MIGYLILPERRVLADVPVITSEAGKSRGSGDPFFFTFFIMREGEICCSKVIDSSNVMHVYTDTVQSSSPFPSVVM
jgi:hypothetical protein